MVSSSTGNTLKIYGNATGDIASSGSLRPHYATGDFSVYQGEPGVAGYKLRFKIDDAGNTFLNPENGVVAIGNGATINSCQVHVSANSGNNGVCVETSQSGNFGFGVRSSVDNSLTKSFSTYNRATSTENFVVYGDGRLGIGPNTPTPDADVQLHVQGNAKITSLAGTNGNRLVYADNDGRLHTESATYTANQWNNNNGGIEYTAGNINMTGMASIGTTSNTSSPIFLANAPTQLNLISNNPVAFTLDFRNAPTSPFFGSNNLRLGQVILTSDNTNTNGTNIDLPFMVYNSTTNKSCGIYNDGSIFSSGNIEAHTFTKDGVALRTSQWSDGGYTVGSGNSTANFYATYYNDGNLGLGTSTPETYSFFAANSCTQTQISPAQYGANKVFHIKSPAPMIRLEDNGSSDPEDMVIQSAGGYGRFISNKSIIFFIDADNNDNDNSSSPRDFRIAKNGNYFGCTPSGGTSDEKDLLVIKESGDASLCGKLLCKEVEVASSWCDYVFDKNYSLKSIMEVENFINENHHLPGIPSAKEVETSGLKMAEMQKAQMEKIEEMMLYIIELKKQNENLQKQIDELKK